MVMFLKPFSRILECSGLSTKTDLQVTDWILTRGGWRIPLRQQSSEFCLLCAPTLESRKTPQSNAEFFFFVRLANDKFAIYSRDKNWSGPPLCKFSQCGWLRQVTTPCVEKLTARVEEAAARVECLLEWQKAAAPSGVMQSANWADFTTQDKLPVLKISASSTS